MHLFRDFHITLEIFNKKKFPRKNQPNQNEGTSKSNENFRKLSDELGLSDTTNHIAY